MICQLAKTCERCRTGRGKTFPVASQTSPDDTTLFSLEAARLLLVRRFPVRFSMSDSLALPPLKRPPVYGVYRWWPVNGEAWIHPFDIGIVKRLVPGNRVMRREDLDETWLRVSYGPIRFRVKSTIWYEVAYEGFDIGDYVEIKSRMGRAEPYVGQIRDMFWNHRYRHIEYFLYRSETPQVRPYQADDMALLDPRSMGDNHSARSWLGGTTFFRREVSGERGKE